MASAVAWSAASNFLPAHSASSAWNDPSRDLCAPAPSPRRLVLGDDALGLGRHDGQRPRRDRQRAGRRQQGRDLPVFLRLERLDLAFAVHHQPQRHRLHPAGAGAAHHLLAEQTAQRVADHAVQDAPRLLGVDAVHVDLAGVRQGVLHRRARDLVEGDAEGALVVQAQLVLDVPGDGLALAVGVGRQEDAVRLAPPRASARPGCPWASAGRCGPCRPCRLPCPATT